MDRQKLEAMVRYCRTAKCRTRMLLEYFGEEPAGEYQCGHCDNDARLSDLRPDPDAVTTSLPPATLALESLLATELEPGEEVVHSTFGKGIVLMVEAEKVEVDFGGHGVRTVRRDLLTPCED